MDGLLKIGREKLRSMVLKRFDVILRLVGVALRALLPTRANLRNMWHRINRLKPFSKKPSITPSRNAGVSIKDWNRARRDSSHHDVL